MEFESAELRAAWARVSAGVRRHSDASSSVSQMEKLDIPPVRKMIEILGDSGARLFACQMAMDMFKRTREDLVPQVEDVISAMDFFDEAAGAQVLFI